MIKVIFAGGKTGGHIFPAIAMATEFKKRFSRSQISFVGTRQGLEKKIVPQYGFELFFTQVRGLSRKSYLSNLFWGFYLLRGLFQSLKILKEKRPHLVVGTGGYVSFPVVMLASLMHIPTIIQEQNSYPGISTRFLARFADRVCLSYPESTSYFPASSKFMVIGNPVREDIIGADRKKSLQEFSLDPDKKTLFVFGGSQGSHAINRALLNCLGLLDSDWQILWQTGEGDYAEVSRKVGAGKIKCMIHPFVQDMKSAYAAADLVISRAGALTLAEITACGKPAILIPYPFAAADHQRHNAQALKKAGAASVIPEKDLTPNRLSEEIYTLLSDQTRLTGMAAKSRKLGKPDANSHLVDEMEKLLRGKKRDLFRD
jgi:UDP-N-acetylglucosamine--N-acetylmuramyl-(pentapeptide) pyrophosphoryl-undecaprenol N-acetylglucosamine transferase